MTKPDAIEFLCPTCGFDLRASLVDNNIFRCPECGALTNTQAIIDENEIRRQANRRTLIAGTLLVIALLVVPWLGAAIKWNLPPAGGAYFFLYAVFFGAFYFMSLFWDAAPTRVRLLYAAGGPLVLTAALGLGFARYGFFLVVWGWHAAFSWWAKRQGYG